VPAWGHSRAGPGRARRPLNALCFRHAEPTRPAACLCGCPRRSGTVLTPGRVVTIQRATCERGPISRHAEPSLTIAMGPGPSSVGRSPPSPSPMWTPSWCSPRCLPAAAAPESPGPRRSSPGSAWVSPRGWVSACSRQPGCVWSRTSGWAWTSPPSLLGPTKSARSSQVGCSCGESGLLGELIEGSAVVAGGGAQSAGRWRVGIGELGQAG
jgi:hypothetical protein